MPGSILECYAAGLLFVSTAPAAFPSLSTTMYGLLVPVKRSSSLAAAAFRLLREPGLAKALASAGLASASAIESTGGQPMSIYTAN